MNDFQLFTEDSVDHSVSFQERLSLELWRNNNSVELGAASIRNIFDVFASSPNSFDFPDVWSKV